MPELATVARAYALLRVKSIDAEQRVITGIASTPEPDRLGDVIESAGITFRNPVPLLLYHKSDKPVGRVTFSAPTAEGLAFSAEIPTIAEPGTLRERVEEAWQSIKAKLLGGVSIGFLPLEDPTFNKKTHGYTFPAVEVVELSLVTIPAHAGASIHTIKSLMAAASGRPDTVSGVAGTRGTTMQTQTVQEQLAAYTQTRATKSARLTALMDASAATGATLNEAQSQEYDELAAEVRALDTHLGRLKALEGTMISQATAIAPVTDPADGSRQRSGAPVITVKANVPQGIPYVRFCMANLWAKGDSMKALEFAKQWRGSTPEVELAIKAAIAPGTTTTATWAAELAPLKPLTEDFLAYLRPATVIGRMGNLKTVPFNVTIATQTGGGTYGWVGQGAPKPVTKLTFGSANLSVTKCAGIIVITEELARISTPSAEEVIRRDMRDGIAQFLDVQFTDPSVAAVAGVNPGSITNGVTAITSAGTSPANARTDLAALLSAIAAAGLPIAGTHVLMSETNLLALSLSTESGGGAAFPGLSPQGGTYAGVTFVGSQSLGTNIVAVAPDGVLIADEGGINIDVSREASIQMDSAPMNPADATTVYTSFWQNNLIGLRAERFINWARARTGAVQRTSQTYVAGALALGATASPTQQPTTL